MRPLPSGTVTFLFSDIEGSTRMLDELGAEAYADALAEHRRLMRDAFTAHGGVEVDTQGDAFFVAFPTATGALAAADAAQATLAEGPIRVRMGIHSGQPLLTVEGYVGIDVHRGARVMSAGHGGQVLVSAATHALLDGTFELRDLGRHRLKDLTEPQPLYQLGDGDFPPLKTLFQTNLPVQPTALVGREAELATVLELLSSARLVTLTGAGGSGKTRLALQAAAELVGAYKDGVWWVPLAALRDPELVEATIGQVVGATDDLAAHLRGKEALLLLDNFEQLVEAAPKIAELLAQTPALHVLATSRERLALAAEQEYPVPLLAPTESVALFTVRARQLKPGFEPDEHVAEICRRLDGLPLAIELAAARIKVLSAATILARLGHSLDLLSTSRRDADDRHRTLRATIEWSYELLQPEEQERFVALAAFAGSFDLDAAEAVGEIDLDVLGAFVDKSLLRGTEQGRFFMLETIREFAGERLESSANSEPRSRHAAYFADLAERADEHIRQDQDLTWLPRLDLELPNMREALSHARRTGDSPTAVGLAGSLAYFWWLRGHISEGRAWLEAALAMPPLEASRIRARAMNGAAALAVHAGDLETGRLHSEASLEIWRDLEDRDGIVRALNELGKIAVEQRELDRAEHLFSEAVSLARTYDPYWVVILTLNRAEASLERGEPAAAYRLSEEAAAGARRLDYAIGLCGARLNSAWATVSIGDERRARDALCEALRLAVELGFKESVSRALILAAYLARRSDPAGAARILGAFATLREESGFSMTVAENRFYERVLEQVLQGDDASARIEEGRALGMEEATDYALRIIEAA